jgi:hypothetical protein
MMERQVNGSTRTPIPQWWSSNDNRQKPLSMGRSTFSGDAVARIYKPSRAATTSGAARSRGWRLVFERRTAPFIEPLMGYTGSRDTLTQVELNFPTLESAVRYAERQGLSYVVQNPTEQADDGATNSRPAKPGRSTYGFSNMTLDRLGLGALQECYGRALDGAANRNDPSGPESWTSPMGVARDPKLTLEAKRSILMNWAWTEYLIDLATNEGMPENNRPSRLDEVEQALLALEREVAADEVDSGMRKAA